MIDKITEILYDYYPQLICGIVSGIIGAVIAMKLFL